MGAMSKEYFREYRKRKAQAVQGASASVQAVQARSEQAEQASPTVLASSSPARPRDVAVLFQPCEPAAFLDVCQRLARRERWSDIEAVTGVSWGSARERGRMEGYRDAWAAAMASAKEEDQRQIVEAGRDMLQVAAGVVPMHETEEETPRGKRKSKTWTRSPAALDSAAAKLDPERFGKLAGAKAAAEATGPRQITVVYLDQRRQGEEIPGAPTLEAAP
jgi:hypothetical protein